jgi:hypothetical protein
VAAILPAGRGGTFPGRPRLLHSALVFRRRRRTQVSPEARAAFQAFRRTLDTVEEAKGRLAAAAPGGRRAGVPLAEALAGFEEALAEAAASMGGWRTSALEDVWLSCSEGLGEAARRAEGLRLGDAPEGYERLYGVLGDLMAPLEAFAAAAERFRALGR